MYLARVIGTKVLPNEPVPPVIRIEELVSMGVGYAPDESHFGL